MTSDPVKYEPSVARAAAVAFPVIALIMLVLFGIAYAVTLIFDFPPSLGLPVLVRVAGGVVVLAGLAAMSWLFKHRGPATVVVSTYVTFTKIFRKAPLAELSGRTETLVVSGPQRYVRHPLYAGVIVMVLGWALVASATFVLIATLVVFLWFRLLLIPFEEKELNALFGEQYRHYCDEVPMLFPFKKGKRKGV
jgi:protein-S-isoprenylcysteine O-methyltransferase Ste14